MDTLLGTNPWIIAANVAFVAFVLITIWQELDRTGRDD